MSDLDSVAGNGRQAIVWETGGYLPALLAKLRVHGWQTQAIVSETSMTSSIDEIPVIPPAKLDLNLDPRAVIFPGDATPDSASSFLDMLSNFHSRNGLTNRIVHPVVFAEKHLYARPRFLVTGLPGSGNMIAQTLCVEIIKNRQAASLTQVDQELVGFASAYYWSLHNLVKPALDERGGLHWHVAPWETAYGAFVTGAKPNIPTWQVTGLPLRSHLWSVDLSFSHEAPTRETIDYFARTGFTVVSLVRHPLDNIVSIAGKICRDSGLEDPGILLRNREWYRSMVGAVSTHFEAILAHQSPSHIFHYEDLLSNPVGYMTRLQELFGVELSAEKLQSAWDQFGLKPLPTALGQHFWKPGGGKWQSYMSPMQKQEILASKLPLLAEALGYNLSELDGNYETAVRWTSLPESQARDIANWDCFYSYFLPKRRTIAHLDIRVVKDRRQRAVAYGYDVDELDLSSFFNGLLGSALFENLIAASDLGDTQPPRWFGAFGH